MDANGDPEVFKGTERGVIASGASGMLGAALRYALTEHGMRVLQLVRRTPTQEGQVCWHPAARPAMADPAKLDGWTAAIHLSGANVAGHRWTEAYRREISASRVESTRALAMLLAGLERPPQTFLVASAVGIYGDRSEELLDESSVTGEGFLAKVCRDWEAAAEPAVKAGIRVVHLRFGVVLDAGSGALAKMAPMFRLGLGGRLGSGRQWMSWVSLDDIVAAALFALKTPQVVGAVNVTAPHPVTNAEFTRALARQFRRPAVLPVPAFALRIALGPMADEALLASQRAVPSKLLDAGFQFIHPKVDEALAALLGRG
jgi:uncharacterized protein (TIGR01777 family)